MISLVRLAVFSAMVLAAVAQPVGAKTYPDPLVLAVPVQISNLDPIFSAKVVCNVQHGTSFQKWGVYPGAMAYGETPVPFNSTTDVNAYSGTLQVKLHLVNGTKSLSSGAFYFCFLTMTPGDKEAGAYDKGASVRQITGYLP
jgi:hypothetical protein